MSECRSSRREGRVGLMRVGHGPEIAKKRTSELTGYIGFIIRNYSNQLVVHHDVGLK